MSATVISLVGYIAWMLVLLLIIAGLRVTATLSGRRAANDFSPAGDDVSPFSGRLCRAHANCYESFPLHGGLLLAATAIDMTALTDGLALWALAARIGQSLVHLFSTSVAAVQLRFALFLAQFAIWAIWTWRLLLAALGV